MTYILRNICESDVEKLFRWRNDPNVRQNSLDKKEILLVDHIKWFQTIIESDSIVTYILEFEGTSVGAIRFDLEEMGSTKINYLINPSQQGKGLGSKLMNLGLKKLSGENLDLKKVYGVVLKDNHASIKIFQKFSFNKVAENKEELKFEKKLNENRK